MVPNSDLKGAEAKVVALDAKALAASFRDVRSRTTTLVEPLSAEDCAAQSMEDASPAKWHLAHTTWFFETFVLEDFDPGYRVFDRSFRVLFNSYYNAIGEQHPRPRRGILTRPGLSEVLRYRESVDSALLRKLEAGSLSEAREWFAYALERGGEDWKGAGGIAQDLVRLSEAHLARSGVSNVRGGVAR